MNKVLEWCAHHKTDPQTTNDDDSDSRKKTTDIEEWDQKFMQVDQEMLFEIILVGGLQLATQALKPTLYLFRLPTTLTSRLCWMSVARPLRI